MKLLTSLILGAALAMATTVTIAQPPRPEKAVAQLGLSPELREQVLATFAAARSKHEALREGAEAQRAANDAAFCAIRSETQASLAKILSKEQLDALNAAMRPPRHHDDAERGHGMQGGGTGQMQGGGRGGPEGMRGGRNGGSGGAMGERGGDRRPPPPPRCDDAPASNNPSGE